MASYFVAPESPSDARHAVHDRSRCAPGRFPAREGVEYLGEFLEAAQAVAVARLRYPGACCCTCCAPQPAAAAETGALSSARP